MSIFIVRSVFDGSSANRTPNVLKKIELNTLHQPDAGSFPAKVPLA